MLRFVDTQRIITASLLLAGLLILASGSVFAQALSSSPSGALYFDMGQDSAWVEGSAVEGAVETATVPFSILWDTTGVGTISVVQVQATYDATLLELESVAATANWTGDFDHSVFVDGDSIGYLLLEFTAGSMNPPASATDLAEATFSAKCQAELSTNPLELVTNPAIGFVIADGNKYYPAAGNWSDGAVITRDYWSTFYLLDHTFSGSVGEGQWIGMLMTSNFSMHRASLRLVFDTSLLYLAQMNWDTAYFSYGSCLQLGDGSYQLTLTTGDKSPSTYQDQVCSLLFVPQCGLVNDTASIEIVNDSSLVWPLPSDCGAIRSADWYDRDGFIAEIDSAGLTGYFDADPVGMYDFSEPVVDLIVQAYNTFETGMQDPASAPITFNLHGDGNYGYSSHSTESGDLVFGYVQQNDSLICLQQSWDGDTAVQGPTETPVYLHTVGLKWKPGGFTPSWADRFAPPPTFVDSFPQAFGRTMLPGTEGCIEATDANGILTYGDIEPLEVKVGQFRGQFVTVNSNCPDQDLYVRGNFPVDSFSVTVHVRSICDIEDWDNIRTGVVYNRIDDSTVQIYTNGSFTPISDTGLTAVARLYYECESGCGTSCDLQVHYDDGHMFGSAADSQFVELAPGYVHLNATVWCHHRLYRDFERADNHGDQPPKAEDLESPIEYALYQNYPNPFNPVTSISFDLPHGGDWSLKVYNIAGQVIDEFEGSSAAGTVSVDWDASRHASGVYLYRLQTADYAATKKMLLIK